MHQKAKSKAKNKSAVVNSGRKQDFTVKQVSFHVKDIKCGGRLYLPEGIKKPPVIIMANGFGQEMAFGIPAYAEKFAKSGFAVMTFDYRHFGESEGEPRHYISPKTQLEDWNSSIEYARKLKEVDGERICIWGFSYGGGHVIVTAALNREVAAFISHVPHMDSLVFIRETGLKKIMLLNIAACRDFFNSITGRAPYCIPIVGKPEDLACLNTAECYEGYLSIVPENSVWKNELPARFMFGTAWYRPVSYIPRLKCRGMVVYGEFDSLTGADLVEKGFKNSPQIELLKLQCGHFKLFKGEYYKIASAAEIKFLKSVFE